jgi:prophage regulatory protein
MNKPGRSELMPDRILRVRDLPAIVGMSRTTIYEREARGEFPARRSLGGGRIGWLESEIQEWIRTRPVVTPCAADAAA